MHNLFLNINSHSRVKEMKKIPMLLLVLAMVVMASACTNKIKYGPQTGLIREGKLVIGIDDRFPPMGYRDERNNIVGFDIDLARAVAEDMGLKAEFIVIDWAVKEEYLINGKIDVIWNGYTVTEPRKEAVDFSKPYLENAQVVVVRASANLNDFSDLMGRNVALQEKSSAENAVRANPELYNAIKDTMIQYADNVTALYNLRDGKLDALVVDRVVAEYYIAKEPGTYRILEETLQPEVYGVGVVKGNTVLLEKVQASLDKLIANGKAEEISVAWFGEDRVLK